MKQLGIPVDASILGMNDVGRHSALRLLQDHASRIAIVFTDVMMASVTDGLELARIVSRRWPWIGLLVTSSGDVPRRSALPQKAEFLSKPWHPDEVTGFMLPRLLAAL